MKQLFSIGESVIRQAQNYPEGNGIYTITSIITKQEYEERYPNPFGWDHLDGIYYGLEGFSVTLENLGGTQMKIICHHTAQGNLRKRHERGEYSFDQLMNTLKSPQKLLN
jgi:hypothetical protein